MLYSIDIKYRKLYASKVHFSGVMGTLSNSDIAEEKEIETYYHDAREIEVGDKLPQLR